MFSSCQDNKRTDMLQPRIPKQCIVFIHNKLGNLKIYCVEQYAKVTAEGSNACFFSEVEENAQARGEESVKNRVIHKIQGSNLAENIARLRLEGFGVDDDNEATPEKFQHPKPS